MKERRIVEYEDELLAAQGIAAISFHRRSYYEYHLVRVSLILQQLSVSEVASANLEHWNEIAK